jgi:hypothetical protein
MTPEQKIQYEVRLALGREPDLELNVNIQGVFCDSRGIPRHVGLSNGAPDLIGILGPAGRLFALEVKSENGRLSKDQFLCIARWKKLGAFVAVVRSADEARAALQRARKGESE